METDPVRPLTSTGFELADAWVLLPSWPWPFAPQQRTLPSASWAQVLLPPAAMATAAVRPDTETGVGAFGAGRATPLPSSPEPFLPQHRPDPDARTAQVWEVPAARSMTLARPLTAIGVAAIVAPLGTVPPSWPEASSP